MELKERINEVKNSTFSEDEKKEQKSKISPMPQKTSLCRALTYFIIYSFLGFVIETLFALINFGVLESRQGFLYGPFSPIYGIGAVAIIVTLKAKFTKNNYTLFFGGFLMGSITEYVVSFFGEAILNVKWWDYSDRFLNINGRICLMYSIFWGLLGLYLLKSINPKIDKFIDWLKTKFNVVFLKIVTYLIIVFLVIDCILSAYAISVFLIKVSVEKDLPVENPEAVRNAYYRIYGDEKKAHFINKYWNKETMLLTYPNLTITLEDGKTKRIQNLYPDCKVYYYKFDKNLKKIIQ